MMVSVPAAERRPSSYPAVLTVRVIVAAIGFASNEVRVFANNSSTQENMKQKKAATPIPDTTGKMVRRTQLEVPFYWFTTRKKDVYLLKIYILKTHRPQAKQQKQK